MEVERGMEDQDENNDYEQTILAGSHLPVSTFNNASNCSDSMSQEKASTANESKHSAVWTTSATSLLLKLYEAKLEMLETPKKKTRIWMAISDNLKNYNIEMSPDQVRWKINALTKKYKQCIDSGQHKKFKYFNEMDNIYAQYDVDCDTYSILELIQKKNDNRKISTNECVSMKPIPESKAIVELRKIRLAKKIESDRAQSKISLEKQWLEYLRKQEEQKQLREEVCEKYIKLREEELTLRKRELKIKEELEIRKLKSKEKEQEELLQIEREKCEILKKIFL